MSREILTKALEPFGMIPEVTGLYFVEDKATYDRNPRTYLALEMAERHQVTAVYLRFFEDPSRPPKPEVYVFYQRDFSPQPIPIEERIRRVWNEGIVQQCYFFSPKEARFYNSWELPLKNGVWSPTKLEEFEWATVSKEITDRYNARLLDSGLFWETPIGKTFKQEKTAYRQLLEAVKKTKAGILQDSDVPEPIAKRLLVMTILLRYLEDRGKEDGEAALKAEEFYPEFTKGKKGKSLSEVYRNGNACIQMFERLASANDLNGEVFTLDEVEKKAIRKSNLEWLALFADGSTKFTGKPKEYGQLSLWQLYSFDYLPIELISHIYEDFAISEEDADSSGVVYTPPQLVQFLLDEVLPLREDSPRSLRILDPACGSGIFLVGAYKRLIQLWRMDHQWHHPSESDIPTLQQLLSDCIFGCDKNKEAVRLTYFSLNLALLDSLSPKDIWEKKVHFQNLTDRNLFGEDFFLKADSLEKFDLIIGNPPFLSKLSPPAKETEMVLRTDHGYPELPDTQIALLFLAKSLEILNPQGKCCLILPSGPILYNNGSHRYRRHLLENFKFKTIFDFTALRTSLFSASKSKARPAVVAVFVDQSIPQISGISHVILRKNSAAEEGVAFETDGYDTHWVGLGEALESERIWQGNFMGGGRLRFLAKRFCGVSSLEIFLKEKRKKNKWQFGEGWQLATEQVASGKKKPVVRCIELAEKAHRTEAEEKEFQDLRKSHEGIWITGKKYLETDFLTIKGIDESGIFISEDRFFHRPRTRTRKIFEPPHLMIKEGTGNGGMFVALSEEYLTFKDQVIGIHAPKAEIETLRAIESYLKSEFHVPLLWLSSGKIIGNREGVPVQKDILALPFPSLKLSEIEAVLLQDIGEYQIDFRKNGSQSKVLRPITNTNDELLVGYQEWYLKVINSVYQEFKASTPIIGKEYIGIAFYLGDEPNTSIPKNPEEFEQKVLSVLKYEYSHQLHVRRFIITYQENVVFILKPNQVRYWTRSIGIIDADATFADLVAQGY